MSARLSRAASRGSERAVRKSISEDLKVKIQARIDDVKTKAELRLSTLKRKTSALTNEKDEEISRLLALNEALQIDKQALVQQVEDVTSGDGEWEKQKSNKTKKSKSEKSIATDVGEGDEVPILESMKKSRIPKNNKLLEEEEDDNSTGSATGASTVMRVSSAVPIVQVTKDLKITDVNSAAETHRRRKNDGVDDMLVNYFNEKAVIAFQRVINKYATEPDEPKSTEAAFDLPGDEFWKFAKKLALKLHGNEKIVSLADTLMKFRCSVRPMVVDFRNQFQTANIFDAMISDYPPDKRSKTENDEAVQVMKANMFGPPSSRDEITNKVVRIVFSSAAKYAAPEALMETVFDTVQPWQDAHQLLTDVHFFNDDNKASSDKSAPYKGKDKSSTSDKKDPFSSSKGKTPTTTSASHEKDKRSDRDRRHSLCGKEHPSDVECAFTDHHDRNRDASMSWWATPVGLAYIKIGETKGLKQGYRLNSEKTALIQSSASKLTI
jgi:hypothetical protein